MEPEELAWLHENAKHHQRIVEIGSYLGRSTCALAESTPGIVWAIDNFYGPTDGCPVPDRETIFDRFWANLKDEIVSGKVIPVKANYADVEPWVADMIFIDGDHQYESVKADIVKWKPFVANGGLLCGHDLDFRFPGVEQALNELVPNFKRGPGRIWYSHEV